MHYALIGSQAERDDKSNGFGRGECVVALTLTLTRS